MSHYFEEGFSVREKMWHGLGTVLEDYPGRDEAMRLAGHDFEVTEHEVYTIEQFGELPVYKQVKGFKELRNSKTGKSLNVVKNSYGVVQNDMLWDIVDALVDQPNVKYETAGVLKEGAVLWVLAKLDEPFQVKGDDSLIFPYITASTTHDGTGACRAESTDIRVVCWNTFSMSQARSNRAGTSFTFKHTKTVRDRIEDAKEAIRGVRAQHHDFMELAQELAEITMRQDQIQKFLERMIPMPQAQIDGVMVSDRVAHNIEEARNAVKAILNSQTTADAHRNTGFGVWQAGIEYLDHVRGTKGDAKLSKFNRSIMSQPATKSKLATLVREAVAA